MLPGVSQRKMLAGGCLPCCNAATSSFWDYPFAFCQRKQMGTQEHGKEKVPEVRYCGMVSGSQVFLLQHQENRMWDCSWCSSSLVSKSPTLLSACCYSRGRFWCHILRAFPLLLCCLAALTETSSALKARRSSH